MPDETSHLPDRSEGDAESALESAARHLRGTPRPAGTSALGGRKVFRGRQERDLFDWAEKSGHLIPRPDFASLHTFGGEEHRVWESADRARHFKATRPGRCGFFVICGEETGFLPDLTGALPLEYLERLLLQNQIFGDRMTLEGVTRENGELVIVSSQPTILGDGLDREEIIAFMSKLWFQPLRGLSLGRPGALAFYRDLDEIAAFDAHPGNFVKDENGIVLPIDLVLLRASDELQNALRPFHG